MSRRRVWGATLIALSVVASCAGCVGRLHNMGTGLEDVRNLIHKLDCRDGAPARILVDPHCQDGICGVTCAPDRWK